MKTKTVYETTDGAEFSSEEDAKAHQDYLNSKDQLKSEVLEDISKVLIKLQNIKASSMYDSFDKDQTAEDEHLSMIKSVLQKLALASNVQKLLQIDDYYSSNC